MQTLRSKRPEIPVQGFGGHTHRRDFHIYDNMSSAIESGKYCDTVGWVSLDGIESQSVQKAASIEVKSPLVKESDLVRADNKSCPQTKQFDMKLTRRWLDWNRLTFAYHAVGSQSTFSAPKGLQVTQGITDDRKSLNLTFTYGCAPRSYCISCKPYGEGNIYTLVQKAAAATVVNPDRGGKWRVIIVNQGAIRYDLVQGPFTVDDSYIVCPYTSTFNTSPMFLTPSPQKS
ncbi:hypothetical protein N7486_003406 [Penicillium sp. IBT 16267x]|nr:hypothetical protein N7486_003406 [Penicillium sp. IBT 16267x]